MKQLWASGDSGASGASGDSPVSLPNTLVAGHLLSFKPLNGSCSCKFEPTQAWVACIPACHPSPAGPGGLSSPHAAPASEACLGGGAHALPGQPHLLFLHCARPTLCDLARQCLPCDECVSCACCCARDGGGPGLCETGQAWLRLGIGSFFSLLVVTAASLAPHCRCRRWPFFPPGAACRRGRCCLAHPAATGLMAPPHQAGCGDARGAGPNPHGGARPACPEPGHRLGDNGGLQPPLAA